MNEIAKRESNTGLDSPANILGNGAAGTVQLAEWAQELSAAHKLGTALCQTDFVPKDFRGKPEAAAAAILAGKALGLDPMNSLSNIFVVHGRPALYARTMAAIVMREGHEVVRTEATPDSVTVKARRKGSKEWQEFTWTMERARLAKYVSNEKYKTNPVEMLYAKALAEACRVIAPDVLTGVAAYSVEEIELEDMGETAGKPATQSASSRLAEAVKTTAPTETKESEPEPEPEADKSTGEVKDDPASTLPQQRKIAILLDNDGYKERADKLDVLSAWTDREITTSKDLTKAEASKFIDEFESKGDDDEGRTATTTDTDQAWLEGANS